MTDYAIYQGIAADTAGNVIASANVEVRSEASGNLVQLFSGRTGGAKSNPFTADSDGYFAFYTVGAALKVRIYTGPSGAPTSERIFRYVPVGRAGEFDVDTIMRVVQDGSAAAPGLAFASAPDTGIYAPAVDALAIATNGSERLRVDATGNLIMASDYINFSASSGETGYGIRDNAGTMEIKNSGGAWQAPSSGVGSSPQGQCRLSYVSTTSIRLDRYNGKYLFIDGTNQEISSSGPTVSNSGLNPSTVYYCYAFMSGSPAVITLELSTTVPVLDSTYGIYVKTGTPARTYVGRVITDANSPTLFYELGTPSLALAVQSKYNPRRIFRVDYHLWGPIAGLGYAVPDGTGNGTFAFLTGTTAQALNYAPYIGGSLKIHRAMFRVIWGCNTTSNRVRLVHADDGPANITQIVSVSSTNGGVANNASDVGTDLQAILDAMVTKSLLVQFDKINGTTFTLYRVCLEVWYEFSDLT